MTIFFKDEDAIEAAFEKKLDALYAEYAQIATSRTRIRKGADWDVIRFDAFPRNGLVTFITHGVSGFYLYQDDNEPQNRLRHEISVTVRKEFGEYDPCAEMNHAADMVLQRKRAITQNCLVEYGYFDSLPKPVGLRFPCALFKQAYLLADVRNRISDKPYPLQIVELISLHEEEAALAHDDIGKFLELVDSGALDILDLDRNPVV